MSIPPTALTQIELRPQGREANRFLLGKRHVLLERSIDPGCFWRVPYWEASGETDVRRLARELPAESYGKIALLLCLPALFIYYGREVGWALYVLAAFAALPIVFILRAYLRPARKRMNFLGSKLGTGFSIGYNADEEAKVLAFSEGLQQRLRAGEPRASPPDHGAGAVTQLEVKPRRGKAARFALEETGIVVFPRRAGDKEERWEYWQISPQHTRSPLKTGLTGYLFCEDADGEPLVNIVFDADEEPRVEAFVLAFEEKLEAWAERRKQERDREYNEDET